jgi:predicted esterase
MFSLRRPIPAILGVAATALALTAAALVPAHLASASAFALHPQAAVDTANQTRGPLLLISGTEDHTVPDVTTRSSFKQYRHSTAITELRQFDLSWLTILGSGLTRSCDLHIPGS